MKRFLRRLVSSSLIATTSVFAFDLVTPSLPRSFQSLFPPAQALATEMPADESYDPAVPGGGIHTQPVSSTVMLHPLDEDFKPLGTIGSGFVVHSTGLIVTKAHVVVDQPALVVVLFEDGSHGLAMVVDDDAQGSDLAALQLVIGDFQAPTLILATEEIPQR